MRPPRTAKDDQPGPIGRRHSCDRRRRSPVGLDPHAGDDVVAMGSAKAGPVGSRLPSCGSRRECRRLTAGSGHQPFLGSPARLPEPAVAPPARCRVGPGQFLRSRRGCPNRRKRPRRVAGLPASRSSGVFVHRQCKSLRKLLAVKPPVRTSVHPPHASRMVATIDTRRSPSGRRGWPPPTPRRRGPRPGSPRWGTTSPCAPVAIDTSTMRLSRTARRSSGRRRPSARTKPPG
jgi:hypothetical protein